MPVYNAADFVTGALDSLLAQTYGNLEIIVVDNASTDATGEICAAKARADRRIRYFRNDTNVGVFNNYSLAFRHSSGALFKWATAADWHAPTFVAVCVEELRRRSDVVLCGTRAKLFSEDLGSAEAYDDNNMNLLDESPSARFARLYAVIGLNNIMYGVIRREALERTRLHRPYYQSDVVLLAELALMGKFVELPEYLFFRRMTRQTATQLMGRAERESYMFGRAVRAPSSGRLQRSLDLLALVWRSPLRLRERGRLLSQVARRLYWDQRRVMASPAP